MDIKSDEIKKVYVIGIKGSGVIAVVEILHSLGVEVIGSDVDEKFFTDKILDKLGIKYFENFSVDNIPNDVDLVIYSTAYNEENNIEFKEAKKRKMIMVSYPEMVAYFFNQKFGIAVTGTHGKTTTSAMLADVLLKIGVNPGAIIGSKVIDWEGNSLFGKGEYFVAEADEYKNKLNLYNPKSVILTSCDFDHPDFFADFSEYKKVFKDFVRRIPVTGFLTVWSGSVDTLEISKEAKCKILTYGFEEGSEYRILNYKSENKKQIFEIFYKDNKLEVFEIDLVGRHNVLNATAVIATCHKLGLDLKKVSKALSIFRGTKRRFEYIGEKNGAILIDDYGHHPEEIKATLKGAREIYPDKNIWTVFHPHSYSRTEALLHEFSQSFDDADQVIVLDIYGSARENFGKVNSKDLVELINKYNPQKAQYLSKISEAVDFLENNISSNDVVIALGAGNVWEVVEKIKEKVV